MIDKLIFKAGVSFRNPSLPGALAFLKCSETWDRMRLKTYQLDCLRNLLAFSANHSPYYQDVLSLVEIRKFNCLEDIKKVPTIAKRTLIEENTRIHTTENYKFKKLFVSETSGSTGEPLKFLKDEVSDSWNRAAIFRGYSWYSVQPWVRNGYFWGYNIDPFRARKVKRLDYLQNRFRAFSYDVEGLRVFIKKLEQASYLHGYSSMIYEVARIVNAEGIDNSRLNLKLVKGTSEKIYDHYQPEIEKAFGRKMISEYGAAETGIIAFECPHGAMHLNMEGCLVEEEAGEIIVTNLNSYSFPIIRYKLGDSIVLEDESYVCPCGMKHQVLREVTGRVGKRIWGKERAYPSLTVYYVFKNLYLDRGITINGQFVQTERGSLDVCVEEALTEPLRQALNDELAKYFGRDMTWTFHERAVIHLREGKRRDFITELE